MSLPEQILVVLAFATIAHCAEDADAEVQQVAETGKTVEKRALYGGYSGVGYQAGAYDPSYAGAGVGYSGAGLGYAGAGGLGGYGGLSGLNGGYTSGGYLSGYYPKAVSKVAYTIGHGGNLYFRGGFERDRDTHNTIHWMESWRRN